MQIRDRVKQTGTATSDTAYVLTGGAAESGYQTFATAFDFPAPGADTTYSNVPVLVETATAWQIVVCQLLRDDPSNAVLLQNGVVYASSTGAPLGLTGAAAVTVSVVPSEALFGQFAIAPRPAYTAETDGADNGSGDATTHPYLDNSGLLAYGPGSRANGLHTLALGYRATVDHALASVLGGYRLYSGAPGEQNSGVGIVDVASAGVAVMRARGAYSAHTTDATATKLAFRYGPSPATSVQQGWSIQDGVTVLTGTLTAVATATGNKKVWDVTVVFGNTGGTVTALASTFTEVYEHGSATGWTPAATVVGTTGHIEVTGAAATDISWGFTYDAHRHEVYV